MNNRADILGLIRPELRAFDHYQPVRTQESDTAAVCLDANENPWSPLPRGAMGECGRLYNRYPEPQPRVLLSLLSRLFGCAQDHLLLTRGSDEAIDLVVRLFCRAYEDAVLITPPTFGIYRQAAMVQAARVVEVNLDPEDVGDGGVDRILAAVDADPAIRLVFVCRPNNPVGADLPVEGIARLCEALRGRAMVVCDEAYVEFAEAPSVVSLIGSPHDNLLVLRTLSKAYGLAGARLGAAVAIPEVVSFLRCIAPVYPIARPTIDAVRLALTAQGIQEKQRQVQCLIAERRRLQQALPRHPKIRRVYPSAANFLLLKVDDAEEFCRNLAQRGIIIRSRDRLVADTVRVSIGRAQENTMLLEALGIHVPADAGAGVDMDDRVGQVMRSTRETKIEVRAYLDDSSALAICTGVAFFDHMIEQIARHGGIGLYVRAAGDLEVDTHHTIEDVGLVLGEAIAQALGNRCGVQRFGFHAPMDDARAQVLIDLGGRPYCVFEGQFPDAMVGQFPTAMVEHFLRSFSTTLGANIHASVQGKDSHHMVESVFKALGLALRQAVHRTGSHDVPSTKGKIA